MSNKSFHFTEQYKNLCACKCKCKHMYVVLVCASGSHRLTWSIFLSYSPPYFLKQDFSVNLELLILLVWLAILICLSTSDVLVL